MKAKVRCLNTYTDSELKTRITNNEEDKNYERIVSKERADVLVKAGVCEIIELVKEEKETAVKPKTTTKSKKKQPKKETAIR